MPDHIEAGPHPQVKGVAQYDLRAHVFKRLRHHALDRAIGADRHEDGGLHHAVVERQFAAPGIGAEVGAGAFASRGIGLQNFKFEHLGIVAGVRGEIQAPSGVPQRGFTGQQHGIAIAEKAVSPGNRMPVQRHDVFVA